MTPIGFLLPKQRQMQYPFGQPPEGVDVLWRVEARVYSYVIDADREEYGTTAPVLEATWWKVKRWTPCGARLCEGRIVYLDKAVTRRQWASRTVAEALASFRARRARQVEILTRQLKCAEYEHELADRVTL